MQLDIQTLGWAHTCVHNQFWNLLKLGGGTLLEGGTILVSVWYIHLLLQHRFKAKYLFLCQKLSAWNGKNCLYDNIKMQAYWYIKRNDTLCSFVLWLVPANLFACGYIQMSTANIALLYTNKLKHKFPNTKWVKSKMIGCSKKGSTDNIV